MPPFENDDLTGLYGLSLDSSDDTCPPRPRPIPLIGVQLKAETADFIAQVQLSQAYHNDSDKALETVYHFPIYDGAAVCGFEAEYEDGRCIKGVIKEKFAARTEYEAAKQAGRQANLLESVRRDVFTLKVGNIPGGGYVKTTITFVMTLEARDDAIALVLPTSIAPRYIPAATASAVGGDAQALAPPETVVKWFGLDIQLDVECRSDIKAITCPTHEKDIHVALKGKGGHIALNDITMDRDVVVMIREEKVHQPRASIEISEGKDGSSSAMTGFVTFYPQIEFPDQKREFIFVVDRSGSMHGQQIAQARDTLLLFLRSLPPSCTFNIIGFGSSFESLFSTPQPYNDDTLETASQHVSSMNSDLGGTEILSPLKDVFNHQRTWFVPNNVERQVFVLTDGQVSNDRQVFDLIRQNCALKEKNRLFCVGIGQNVSRHLVSGMARAGRGTARFVEDGSADALRVKVLGQLKQSLQPSLDDVSIEWRFPKQEEKKPVQQAIKTLLGYRSPAVDEVNNATMQSPKIFPSRNPPIFSNEKYLSFAMFPVGSPKPEGVTVKCETIDGPLALDLDIPKEETFHGSIARKLAARAAITEFEDRQRHGCWGPSLSTATDDINSSLSANEALQLALENNLTSDKTSFLATSDGCVVDLYGPRETKVILQQAKPGFRSLANTIGSVQRFSSLHHDVDLDGLVRQSCALSCQSKMYYKQSKRTVNLPFVDLFGDLFHNFVSFMSGVGGNIVSLLGGFFVYIIDLFRHKRSGVAEEKRMKLRESPTNKSPAVAVPTNRDVVPKKIHIQEAGSVVVAKDDKMTALCMLQKANGSFLLNEDILQAVGLSKPQTDGMISRLGLSKRSQVVYATGLAVVILRIEFAKKRSVWELQEQKALSFLSWAYNGTLTELLQKLEAEVPALHLK